MRQALFSMQKLDTPIHKLSGLTKLICFMLLTGAVMFSYDIRVILCVMAFSFVMLKLSRITFRSIRLMVVYVGAFLVINAVLTFLFAPRYGTEIYGTQTVWFTLFGSYAVTSETLFFILTKMIKYASVIPLGMIFLMTTDPSELAASLSSVGVPYKAGFAFALTLRYFPDVQREYRNISQAQQARGLEMSGKAKPKDRFVRAISIILPLILSTMDRIDTITNAMDLRGFGKYKKRTWYVKRPLTRADILALFVSAVLLLCTIAVSVFVNHSRFYNPFV
ncbi:MAG: energy-coupling factor transporter transmembrane component T [Bacillota bacterium]